MTAKQVINMSQRDRHHCLNNGSKGSNGSPGRSHCRCDTTAPAAGESRAELLIRRKLAPYLLGGYRQNFASA